MGQRRKSVVLGVAAGAGLGLLCGTCAPVMHMSWKRHKALTELQHVRRQSDEVKKELAREKRLFEVYMPENARLKSLMKELDRVNERGSRRLERHSRWRTRDIRSHVMPLYPMIPLYVERCKEFWRKKGFEPRLFHLVFALQSGAHRYLAYQTTSRRQVPRPFEEIAKYATGSCKEYSIMLASLALAAGAKVRYVSAPNRNGGSSGHAYVLIRVFRDPSAQDIKALERLYREYARKWEDGEVPDTPHLKMMGDGLYIVCDPTNYKVPGMLIKGFWPMKDVHMVELKPGDYGIPPACD